jgi:formylmethanofuran dehydrogenase subunit C
MTPLKLTLKTTPNVPLEVEVLTPDRLAGLTLDEVRAQPVQLGKRQLHLADFFDIEGENGEDLQIFGATRQLKSIGRRMTRGRITVHGHVGMHVGAAMRGGEIEVHGDAGDWLGAEMKGGVIRIHGNAGGQVGAAYRGSPAGMKKGTILIDGSAGIEVGMRMRRGTIVIKGPVRDFVGLEMKGGTIVLLSGAEQRVGAWMNRGTIVSLLPLPLLPTFTFACTYQPDFLRLIGRYLTRFGIDIPCTPQDGPYDLYSGDTSIPGKGEILVWRPAFGV